MCFGNKAVNDRVAQRQKQVWSDMTQNVFGVNQQPTEQPAGASPASAVPQTVAAMGNTKPVANAAVTNVAGSSAALPNPAAALVTGGTNQKNKRQFGVNI